MAYEIGWLGKAHSDVNDSRLEPDKSLGPVIFASSPHGASITLVVTVENTGSFTSSSILVFLRKSHIVLAELWAVHTQSSA